MACGKAPPVAGHQLVYMAEPVSENSLKFSRLIFPLWIMAAGFVAGYTFLHWLVLMKIFGVQLQNSSGFKYAPFLFALLPVAWWVPGKLNHLSFPREKFGPWADAVEAVFYALPVLILYVPAYLAVQYVDRAFARLTTVASPGAIVAKPPEKFYRFDAFYLDTARKSVSFSDYVSLRNHTISYEILISCPLYDSMPQSGAAAAVPAAWAGFRYYQTVAGDSVTRSRPYIQAYYAQRIKEFNRHDLQQARYFSRVTDRRRKLGYMVALFRSGGGDSAARLTVFEPSYTPFSRRSGLLLDWVFYSLLIGFLLWTVLVLYTPFKPAVMKQYHRSKK